MELRIEWVFSDPVQAQNALETLLPELNQPHEKRSKTILKANKKVLCAVISAEDEKSLKATSQGFLLKAVALIQKIQKQKE